MTQVGEVGAKRCWHTLLGFALASWAVAGCTDAPPKEFENYVAVGLQEAERGKPQEAEHLLVTAAHYIDFKASPNATVRLAQAFRRVAFAYRQKTDENKAIENFERAVKLMTAARGEDYRELAGVLIDLAQGYKRLGQYGNAEPILERALAIAEKNPRYVYNNLDVALVNIADVYQKLGKFNQAERAYLRYIESLDRKAKDNSLNRIWSSYPRSDLAYLYFQQQRYTEAEPLFQEAIRIMEENKLQYPEVVQTFERYAALLRVTGRAAEAGELEARAKDLRSRLNR